MRYPNLLVFLAAATAIGQTQPPAPQPQFEVVSVKPNAGVDRAVQIGFPSPGTFHARNVWLRFLIQNAWNVKDYQVLGGPAWAASDRYDIEAKGAPGSRDRMRLMIQSLLADRFQLVVHRESRELPVYQLVAAKGGSKLAPSKAICPEGKPQNECTKSSFSPHSVSGTAIAMQDFTTMLANILQRPVIDQTGFSARFDVDLNWIPDQTTPGMMAPGVAPPPLPSDNDAGPTIFTALTESLGLRLVAAKGPVETIVIDRAEKPSGN